jgi:hypothetical protein
MRGLLGLLVVGEGRSLLVLGLGHAGLGGQGGTPTAKAPVACGPSNSR